MTTEKLTGISNYHIKELIFRGTRTFIYRAERESDGLPVVIKILKSSNPLARDVEQLQHEYAIYKKLNEAQLSSVVTAYDLEPLDENVMLILEDFKGQTLHQFLTQEKEIDLKTFLNIAMQLARALGDIHHQHVIHKDINPSNILYDPATQQIKIIDFGIASLLSREIQSLSSLNLLEGTASYISPEQTGRMNRPIDYRTDIYSLGVTLYELATKKLPFEANELVDLIHLHIAKQPVPPHEVDASIPFTLSKIIMKCLAKGAEDRYHSAYGLYNDLKTCLDQFDNKQKIDIFEPAQKDIFDEFHISQKLYGREKEIGILTQVFEKAYKQTAELTLISGYSGIGKSSLVYEIQRPIEEKQGHFISGKFEQFQQNIPYYGFIQAFQMLVQLLLTEPDHILEKWRERLLLALEGNGELICKLIPDLSLIIGEQPTIPKLNPQEEQTRFQSVIINFIQVFLMPEHPLVIFLDDLHWADLSSLNLIEAIFTQPAFKNLLLIGAYRDNEVSLSHPLMNCIEKIEKANRQIQHLVIHPLTIEDTSHLIEDTFLLPETMKNALTDLVYRKTQGNPFFIFQFLRTLYQENLIDFDSQKQCWQADLDKIEKLQVTDNVADFLSKKLHELPSNTLSLLKLGAAVGKSFSVNLLAAIQAKTPTQIVLDLWPACQTEFILQLPNGSLHAGNHENSDIQYMFQHDRIQEAAYQLIPAREREKLHYNIGQTLLHTIPSDQLFDKVIFVVNHLNYGVSFIKEKEERFHLAHLNLRAGEKALQSAGFESAFQYFKIGLSLLNEDDWKDHYSLLLSLYKNYAACSFMTGNFEKAELAYDFALNKAKSPIDKAELYHLKNIFYSHQSRYDDAIQSSIEGLRLFGIDFQRSVPRWRIVLEFLKVKRNLFFKNFNRLHELPLLKDREKILIQSLYMSMGYPIFVKAEDLSPFNLITLRIINLTFKDGISEYSPLAFGFLSMFLGSENQQKYEDAYECSKAAMEMSKNFPLSRFSSVPSFIYYAVTSRFKNPFKDSLAPLEELFYKELRRGNMLIAMSCFFVKLNFLIVMGERLETLERECQKLLEIGKKYNAVFGISYALWVREFARALRGETEDLLEHTPKTEEDRSLVLPQQLQNLIQAAYDSFHVFLYCLYEKYEECIALSKEKAPANIQKIRWQGGILWTLYYFSYALSLIGACLKDRSRTSEYLPLFNDILKRVKKWATLNPENHMGQYILLKAEKYRLKGAFKEAAECYEKAIADAHKQENFFRESLACELAAKFHLELEHTRLASFYIQEAQRLYLKWGATAKAASLIESYPTLFTSTLAAETIEAIAGKTTHKTTRSTISEVELTAIIEASQVISEEVSLEKLLFKLMNIAVNQVSAEKCMLILKENGQLHAAAQIYLTQEPEVLFDRIPIEQKQDDMCLALAYQVATSMKEMLVNDAVHAGPFTQDAYILEKQPFSLLCIPLVNQGKLIGILYLENKERKEPFTFQQMHILSLISSHIAIAIEKAQLYTSLENKVEERAKKIKEMQTQLMQQEKLASLGLLTAGIAHEIKNPLNFVINFSTLALDLIKDIDKYEKEELDQNQEEIKNFKQSISALKENMSAVFQQGKRADSIIQRMLAHSRANPTQKTLVDIHKVLEEYLTLSYHGMKTQYANLNVKMEKAFDSSLKEVEIIPEDIGRVIINLLNNSFHTVFEKAHELGPSFQPQIKISTKNLGASFQIRIRDNGKGIPPHYLEKIFTPFFTTKSPQEGTGLGLSLSHNIIVQEHRGTIEFETKEGEFTEFILTLPLRSQG